VPPFHCRATISLACHHFIVVPPFHCRATISLSCHHFISYFVNKKHTAIPLQAWTDSRRFKEVEAPRFHDNRHMKVLRLLALRTDRLYPQEYIVHLSQAAMSYKACHFESRQRLEETERCLSLPSCYATSTGANSYLRFERNAMTSSSG